MERTDKYNEREYVIRLQSGDRAAFSALYYLHVAKLKLFIQRTAKSPYLTEDVLHDTFVKVWEMREQIDPDRSFMNLLFTIAKNNLLNMLRRAQHESNIISEMAKFAAISDSATDDVIGFNESNTILGEAIDQLSGNVKEVFVLCRMQGMSYKQVAELLGISTSTVNKHMNKALKLVREYVTAKNLLAIILLTISEL